MNQKESSWDVEYVSVEIPGKDYENHLVKLVGALLAVVENLPKQAEDGQVQIEPGFVPVALESEAA